MNQLNFNFLTNYVKRLLQSAKKRLKLFNFLNNKLGPQIFSFYRRHSSLETEKKWIDDFKDNLYYSCGKTDSSGVLMAIFGNLNICVKNKVNDNDGRVLILEATIDGSDNLFINLYNTNTKREQLTTLENLNYFHDKKVIIAGDFNLIFDKKLKSARGGSPLLKKRLLEIIKLKERRSLN